MFTACKRTCGGSDPATDTVKISMTTDDEREAQERAIEAERAQQAERAAAAERASREAAEEEEEERRVVAERQLALEAEQQRQQEEARLRAEAEARRRAEAERLEAERREAELAEQRRREAEEALRQERRARVGDFLREHGFAAVNDPRKKMFRTSYPLHRAAELGDDKIVEALIAEGADVALKNSSGKTPAQVATKKNKNGSHEGTLKVLGGA